jgi:tetratricopeptide (TPR) repeat protein
LGLYELLALCALFLFFYWVAKYVKAAVLRRGAGPDDGPKMRALNREVERLHDRGQFDWALQVAEDTFRRAERALGEDDPTTLEARELLGACLFGMGRAGEALAHHEAVLERRRRLADPLDRFGWTTQNNVAVCYMELGKEDQARETLQAAERMILTVVKPDDPLAIGVRINLAACLARLGQAEKSLGIIDSCLRAWQARFAAAQAQPGEYDTLGWSEIKSGKLARSIATASQARGEGVIPSIVVLAGDDRVIVGPLAPEKWIAMEVISEKAQGQANVGWLDVWFARLKACKALCLMRAGKPVDALPLYRSVLSRSERLLGYAHPYMSMAVKKCR